MRRVLALHLEVDSSTDSVPRADLLEQRISMIGLVEALREADLDVVSSWAEWER